MSQVLSVRRATGGTVQNGTSHFYGFDLAGNARLMTDAAGAVAATSTYSAFGEEIASSDTVVNALRFGGQVGYYSDKISRVYIRARHYQPQQGRWMSADPIGFNGGDRNLYRYVGNDSINRLDPSGLFIDAPGTTWSTSACGLVTVVRKLTTADQNCIGRAICLAMKLHPSGRLKGLLGFWRREARYATYVATMSSCDGITWTNRSGTESHIYINATLLGYCDNCSGKVPSSGLLYNLGATVLHETWHYVDPVNTAHVSPPAKPAVAIEPGVDEPIAGGAVPAARSKGKGCCSICGDSVRIKSQLDQYSCECGIYFRKGVPLKRVGRG
jgi:RHS repeat-associated protein